MYTGHCMSPLQVHVGKQTENCKRERTDRARFSLYF